MRYAFLFLILLIGAGLLMASNGGGGSELTSTLTDICRTIKTLVPLVALIMMMIGGVVYGAGQILGAEMRSRAVVWATSLFMGGIIGLVIAVAAPWLINTIISLNTSAGVTFTTNFC